MMDVDKDWKKKVGFPINYDSGQSSDDDFDANDVVMRPRFSSKVLLTDRGDGAEADLLGTTPPRERIRDKAKRKTSLDVVYIRDSNGKRASEQLVLQPAASPGEVPVPPPRMRGTLASQPVSSSARDYPLSAATLGDTTIPFFNWKESKDRGRKHNRTLQRGRDRDLKADMSQVGKADSLPSPAPPTSDDTPAVPTLVESCSRFMSLTSRLKCREIGAVCDESEQVETRRPPSGDESTSRVNFHKTFSLLINMGNMDKGCRRTISREEQVWQNELKDLIWLELQAKIAGRTLAQQDAYLCAQRNIVPTIVQNIRNYRFVNPNPCNARQRRLCAIEGSREDLTEDAEEGPCHGEQDNADEEDGVYGCLSFNCERCIHAVGKAMREVGTLLDSFYNATMLYPSSKAMTAEHPLIATHLFKNRIKAMCLWYNTALYMRLKVMALRRMLRTMRLKNERRNFRHLASTDSDVSRDISLECQPRACQVRFNMASSNATPTDSNNSDSSGHSEAKESGCEHDTEGEGKENEREGQGKQNEEDEVDSSSGRRVDRSGQTTPEIVISDNRYGTTDTTTSTESGYTSTSSRDSDAGKQHEDVYEIGSLDEVTQLQLLNRVPVSLYRGYHQEMLKTQGVRRCMMFINKMRRNVLPKVYETLEKPDAQGMKPSNSTEEESVEVFDDTKEEEEKPSVEDEAAQRKYELRRFGCWSEESLAMRLPSYRNHFLLLSSICMEATHDYLTLRLEDRPQNPSCLTVKQLLHELKEGLDIATEMRASFAKHIEVALAGHNVGAVARQELLLLIRTYDATVETVLKQYLSYLRTISEVEHLSRWTLQAEWSFTARLAKRIKSAALLAPVTFSEIACNQLDRLLKQFDSKFTDLEKLETSESDPKKQMAYALCREAQCVYASEREATLQAAQWARALAARLQRAPPPAYLTQRANIFNSLMSLRDRIAQQTRFILKQSRMAGDEPPRELEGVAARVRELLLQVYKLGFELHKELYKFAQAPFELLGEKSAKKQLRPASLQAPSARPRPAERRRRPETVLIHQSFNPAMVHNQLHRFVNDSPSNRSPPFGGARRGLATSPPKLRVKFMRSDSIGEDAETNVFDDKLFENINAFGDNQTQTSIELLLSGEQPSLPEEVELRNVAAEARVSEEEKQWAVRVARAVVGFARCWMDFVVERCDTGRGLRPRWASQGLEFLMLACDPCNTKHLTDKEFEELKKQMDGCISHVVGCRSAAARTPDLQPAPSPDVTRRPRPRPSPVPSSSPVSVGREVPAPPTPPSEPDPLLSFHGFEPQAHSKRVLEAVKQLDATRDENLRERKAVGRVLESTNVSAYEPKLRQLKFKWQRGLKIGAGTFGKVYTVVNTESGQLLAMKELSIGVGDRRALQKAANELRVLEGVVHPHLVRYYGCELHREEMLLFMELCVEGSLEALIATSGALVEHTVRRYTKQLVSAILELHNRSIVHRDIKSGNIFLTNEGHCLKLGDFGCAVKIRANTTAAGELQGCVGTQAYMAPEVFMKSSGHGRAADIWSLGCVVTEMASGKRPWSEYDSNYQIMFVVGMGGRPQIPPALSQEGRQFCLACLTHEPDQRPRADALVMHHFLMVKSDYDCNCETAFLVANTE